MKPLLTPPATCGHDDPLGYLTSTPCMRCIKTRLKKEGLA